MSSIAVVAERVVDKPTAPRILVLWYSRTGTTREVGKSIAAALGAEFEEFRIEGESAAPRSYARCGLDILFHRKVKLAPLARDLANYSIVVVGTPVWMSKISSPVRSFLKERGPLLPEVALFLTQGGKSGSELVFAEMERLMGKRAIAKVAMNEGEFTRREYAGKVAAFVIDVRATSRVTA